MEVVSASPRLDVPQAWQTVEGEEMCGSQSLDPWDVAAPQTSASRLEHMVWEGLRRQE